MGNKVSIRRVRGKDTKQLGKNARRALDGLEQQINAQTRVYGVLDDSIPTALKGGDVVIQQSGSTFQFSMADDSGSLFTIPLREGVSNGMALTQSTTAPNTTQLPSDGDSGFHLNTSTSDLYIAINIGGTVKRPTLSTFDGNLPFSRISGTFTDTIHGNLGGGSLHSAATVSTAGFMSATDKTKLNASTASATASTLVERTAAGLVNAAGFQVMGTNVIGARLAAVATVTLTATAVYGTNEQDMLNDCKAKINAIIARLNTTTGHGLISG